MCHSFPSLHHDTNPAPWRHVFAPLRYSFPSLHHDTSPCFIAPQFCTTAPHFPSLHYQTNMLQCTTLLHHCATFFLHCIMIPTPAPLHHTFSPLRGSFPSLHHDTSPCFIAPQFYTTAPHFSLLHYQTNMLQCATAGPLVPPLHRWQRKQSQARGDQFTRI